MKSSFIRRVRSIPGAPQRWARRLRMFVLGWGLGVGSRGEVSEGSSGGDVGEG